VRLWAVLCCIPLVATTIAALVGIWHEATEVDEHGGVDPGYVLGRSADWAKAFVWLSVLVAMAFAVLIVALGAVDAITERRALLGQIPAGQHLIRYADDATTTLGTYLPPVVRQHVAAAHRAADQARAEAESLRRLAASMAKQLADADIPVQLPEPGVPVLNEEKADAR
jgi:heme exporter protein D